jgi:hypothetical protein
VFSTRNGFGPILWHSGLIAEYCIKKAGWKEGNAVEEKQWHYKWMN